MWVAFLLEKNARTRFLPWDCDEPIRGLAWFSWLQKHDTCQQGQHQAHLILEGTGSLCALSRWAARVPL